MYNNHLYNNLKLRKAQLNLRYCPTGDRTIYLAANKGIP